MRAVELWGGGVRVEDKMRGGGVMRGRGEYMGGGYR